MTFARGLGGALSGFVSGFSAISNQFNCIINFPNSSPALILDSDTGMLVPDPNAPTASQSIKLWLEKDSRPSFEVNPGMDDSKIRVKGHLVEPRVIARFPSSENGLEGEFYIAGNRVQCYFYDLQILPTAEMEIMESYQATGLPVIGKIEFRGSGKILGKVKTGQNSFSSAFSKAFD